MSERCQIPISSRGSMYVIDVLKNLLGQELPDKELLAVIVQEVNKYLPDEDKFSMEPLPEVLTVFTVMTLLPDASKYRLYMTKVSVSGTNIKTIEQEGTATVTKSTLDEESGKVVIAVVSVFLCILALTLDPATNLDWSELLYRIVEFLIDKK